MLIAMAVWDTAENARTWMTAYTLSSLCETVNWNKHRLVIVDNGSCAMTRRLYELAKREIPLHLIQLPQNIGTAAAINKAWATRDPGEHCVKTDNDVVIHQADWADWIEDVFEREPSIGICGLKRKDLAESPFAEGDMQSQVYMLPHESGQRWLVVEEVMGVIGTCVGFSSALLDRIGYLNQPGLYGYDDSLASIRAEIAGFKRVFLHGFEINHIDPGGDDYCAEKVAAAGRWFDQFNAMVIQYQAGAKDIYYDGGFGDGV